MQVKGGGGAFPTEGPVRERSLLEQVKEYTEGQDTEDADKLQHPESLCVALLKLILP